MGATYSARDAARRVGLSDAAVRRAIASGRINPTQVDGMWRLTDDDLATLRALRHSRIDARRRTTDAAATSQGDAPASVTHPDALIAMVERQQQQLIEMGRQIGLLQAQLQVAEQELRLLKAPSVTTVTPKGTTVPTPEVSEVSDMPSVNPGKHPTDQAPTSAAHRSAPKPNGQDSSAQQPQRRRWWEFWR